MLEITKTELKEILEINSDVELSCHHIGLVNSKKSNTLSYVTSEKYIEEVNNNSNISAVFACAQLKPYINKKVITTDDPTWAFWTLHNHLVISSERKPIKKTIIHPSSKIHSTAYISENNVFIGENTIIEPNVTIHSNVMIGNNCIIRSGTVCGFDGFEHKKTNNGIISVRHDGMVIINDSVEIGALNSIAKGFSWKDTTIGCNSKTDSLVHIAHCVTIGEQCLITACVEISGSVEIGNNCWLSPNCSVTNSIVLGENVFVGIGAVVTKSFPPKSVIAGNPARLLRMAD